MGCCNNKEETKFNVIFSPKNNRMNKFQTSFHDKDTIDKSNSIFYSKSIIQVPNNNNNELNKENVNNYEGVITINNVLNADLTKYSKSFAEDLAVPIANTPDKFDKEVSLINSKSSRNIAPISNFNLISNDLLKFEYGTEIQHDQSNYLSNNMSLILDKENIQNFLPLSNRKEPKGKDINININSYDITNQYSFNSCEGGINIKGKNGEHKFNTINTYRMKKEVEVTGSMTDRAGNKESNMIKKSSTMISSKKSNKKSINTSGSNNKNSGKKINQKNSSNANTNNNKRSNYETNTLDVVSIDNSFLEDKKSLNENIDNTSLNSSVLNNTNSNTKPPEYKKMSKLSLGKYVHVFGDVVRKDNNNGISINNNSYSHQHQYSNRHARSSIDGDITYLKKVPTSNTANNSFITGPYGVYNSRDHSIEHSPNTSIFRETKDNV